MLQVVLELTVVDLAVRADQAAHAVFLALFEFAFVFVSSLPNKQKCLKKLKIIIRKTENVFVSHSF